MTHWSEFAEQAPELAAFGQLRFKSGVAYLATLREDGGPRVHPVTPIVGERLFLFMEPTSPKGRALRQDGRYALHCAVENSEGGGGEFWVRGHATFTDDPADRIEALQEWSFFWEWDLSESMVRWMTSFATTDDDIERFAAGVAAILA